MNNGDVPRTASRNIIKRTGQMWKVYVAVGIYFLSGYLLALGRTEPERLAPGVSVAYQIAAGVAFIGAMVYVCWAVRCPKCGARWLYMSWGATRWSKWVDWIALLERCPRCEGPHTVQD